MRFITDQQAANIHENLMARDGGLPGYREGASLGAVLERVRNLIRFGGDDFQNPAVTAAMTSYALAIGYPFNDGNKRTSLISGLVVLKVNGVESYPEPQPLAQLILEASSGDLTQEAFIDRYLDLL